MKYFILIFTFLFNYTVSQEFTKEWSEIDTLNWDDFKGNPEPEDNETALTNAGIKYETCGSFSKKKRIKVTFTAIFFQKNSWVIKNKSNNYLLNHEQLHFNITEIFTRKLRKYASENIITFKNIELIYEKLFNEYRQFQINYDKETNHGLNYKKQKEWDLKIKNTLNSLNDFKTNSCY